MFWTRENNLIDNDAASGWLSAVMSLVANTAKFIQRRSGIVGALLLLTALSVAFGRYYFFAPMWHRLNPAWMAEHSALGRWNAEQEAYRRLGTSPDLMFRPDEIHHYGDIRWFEWLLDRVNNGSSSFRVCGCTYTCLEFISNQEFRTNAEWNSWFEANKDQTQEQWLQEGFKRVGTNIHLPPSSEDTEALLSLLGKLSDDPKRVDYELKQGFAASDSIRYNAFRWLRDMGFDSVGYLIERDATHLSSDVVNGIKQYHSRELIMPASDGLGLLAFANGNHQNAPMFYVASYSLFTRCLIELSIAFVIGTCSLGGLILVRREYQASNGG